MTATLDFFTSFLALKYSLKKQSSVHFVLSSDNHSQNLLEWVEKYAVLIGGAKDGQKTWLSVGCCLYQFDFMRAHGLWRTIDDKRGGSRNSDVEPYTKVTRVVDTDSSCPLH